MGFKPIPAAVALVLTLLIWFVIPVPQGVSPDAWHLLALFVGIIAGIIGKAMPIGAMAILGITLVALTGVTNEKTADATKDALSSLNNSLIWMIGIAIIISRGLLKTGLGMRIGYLLISLFGKRTLGVGYSLALADLVIGPVTPSNTARGGAIVHPIMKSIALSFDSDPEKGTEGKIGKYLSLVNFHSNVITCLIFITATAPNPLVVELVAKATNSQIQLSWGTWFLAMVVPGLLAMLLMPLVLYFLYPPEIKQTPNATALAKEHLAAMGPMKREEKIMLGIFLVLLLLWAGTGNPLAYLKLRLSENSNFRRPFVTISFLPDTLNYRENTHPRQRPSRLDRRSKPRLRSQQRRYHHRHRRKSAQPHQQSPRCPNHRRQRRIALYPRTGRRGGLRPPACPDPQ